jgi:hypothetical protein
LGVALAALVAGPAAQAKPLLGAGGAGAALGVAALYLLMRVVRSLRARAVAAQQA